MRLCARLATLATRIIYYLAPYINNIKSNYLIYYYACVRTVDIISLRVNSAWFWHENLHILVRIYFVQILARRDFLFLYFYDWFNTSCNIIFWVFIIFRIFSTLLNLKLKWIIAINLSFIFILLLLEVTMFFCYFFTKNKKLYLSFSSNWSLYKEVNQFRLLSVL